MTRQEAIGRRIKLARKEIGLTQKEVGRLYKCSEAHMSRIEHGLVGIQTHDLERMARLLEKPLAWFLGDDVEVPARDPMAALKDLEIAIEAYIPVYAEVSAGPGVEPIDYVATSRAKKAPESLIAFRARGLCLEPEIGDGDMIVVDKAMEPMSGDLVICIIENEASIKRLRRDTKGNVRLENNHGSYLLSDCLVVGVAVEVNRKLRS